MSPKQLGSILAILLFSSVGCEETPDEKDMAVGPCLSPPWMEQDMPVDAKGDIGTSVCLSIQPDFGPCLSIIQDMGTPTDSGADMPIGPCLTPALDMGKDSSIGPCLSIKPPDMGKEMGALEPGEASPQAVPERESILDRMRGRLPADVMARLSKKDDDSQA